jgi:NodT family efflux transporter outer membrane factor (OMF) lipoprotein
MKTATRLTKHTDGEAHMKRTSLNREQTRHSRRTAIRSFFAVVLTACVFAGCTVGPKYHAPVTQAPPGYKETPTSANSSGPWGVAQPQDATIKGDWWDIFNDPELNSLETQLNINNENIKEYFENFMEARALVAEARAQYFPTLGTAPSYTRQRSSANLTNSANSNGTGVVANVGQQTSLYSLPFDFSWEPDLWGKVRNEVHQAQYAAQVSAADLQNERLTEQASLAEYFYEIHGQDALIKLYSDTVEADKKTLALTQLLYNTGVDDRLSVAEAENTLESAESEATNLEILRAQYEHAIAVLVGKAPADLSIPDRPITVAPPPMPIGVPSDLLQRRPDIAAAERTMAEANAEIGVARAAYFPSLTISATGGSESSAAQRLLDWPSRFWSVGASVSETIYDGGLRRATEHQYIAVYNADLAAYRQTVLTAFQQVEDALAEVRILSGQIEQQRNVVSSAQTELNLELARYRTGVDPYLDVVTLQLNLLSDQQTLTTIQIEQMTGAVELVAALGGGWDRSQLPTPSQVSATPPRADTTMQQ